MRRLLLCSALLAFAAVTTPAKAQTAAEIIDRYIDAIGGRQAVAKIETMKYDRTVLNTDNEATTQQSRKTIYRKRPCFYRTEDAETGRIFVSDGTDGWSGARAAGSDSIAWRQASFVPRSPDLDFHRLLGSFIDYDRKGYSAEHAGRAERDGVRLDIVTVTWSEGHRWDFYFAASTGLCYGFSPNPDDPDNFIRVDDYRRVGDVLVPHRNMSIDEPEDGRTRRHERIYSDIEFNVVISEASFLPGKR
jgi:outer membrane lipoprotein-sorting protein